MLIWWTKFLLSGNSLVAVESGVRAHLVHSEQSGDGYTNSILPILFYLSLCVT